MVVFLGIILYGRIRFKPQGLCHDGPIIVRPSSMPAGES